MNMVQLIFVAIIGLSLTSLSSAYWTYGNMEDWPDKNHYCGGKSQSPIDLKFNISHYDARLLPLHLEEHTRDNGILINNGHTAQINMNNHFHLKHITQYSEDYIVEQVHFHWGDDDSVNGSEHLLEGRSYPLEMHIVSYSSLYKDIFSAISNTRGLAVIGVFFEVTNESNPLLEPLIAGLAKVPHKNDEIPVDKNFDVNVLIGKDRLRRYFRYDGSLTTPPCYESVIWTLLHDTIPLSPKQLDAFRSLHNEHKVLLLNNFRPIQSLGTRKLFRSFTVEHLEDERKQRLEQEKNEGLSLRTHAQLLLILNGLLKASF